MIDKELRKKLNLPMTKEIVYHRVKKNSVETFDVEFIEVLKEHSPSGSFSLQITLLESLFNKSEKVNILSDYLTEMQKATFVKDKQSN